MDNAPVLLLGFLLIFHIIGAIALGVSTRGLWRALEGQTEGIFGHIFFFIFGGLFSCAPLVYGLQARDPGPILTVQFSVLVVVFVISALFGQTLVRGMASLFTINGGLVVLGLLFIGGGLFAAFNTIEQGESLVIGVVIGGTFGLIGLVIALLGLINYYRNRS